MVDKTVHRSLAGFTLLEVMVAVALLALALTSVFSGEVAAIKVDQRGRRLLLATNLVRCKMGEVEEKIAKEGMPAVLAEDEDDCCTEGKIEGYRCKWKIERIVLPDITDDDPLNFKKDKKDGDGKDKRAGAMKDTPPESMLSQKSKFSADNTAAFSMQGLSTGLDKGVGTDAIGQMAMQYAFPVLKPVIEEQVRRVTVKIEWSEGQKKRSFDVSQFLVSELPPTSMTNPGGLPGVLPGSAPGASGAPPSTGAPAAGAK